MKFWQYRYGPGVNKDMVDEVMRHTQAFDFLAELGKMYPKQFYARIGNEYTEIETQSAFYFAAIRKKLVAAWDVAASGPKIDPENSVGMENNPLDISDFGMSLQDFKIIMMLASDNEHQ